MGIGAVHVAANQRKSDIVCVAERQLRLVRETDWRKNAGSIRPNLVAWHVEDLLRRRQPRLGCVREHEHKIGRRERSRQRQIGNVYLGRGGRNQQQDRRARERAEKDFAFHKLTLSLASSVSSCAPASASSQPSVARVGSNQTSSVSEST